MLDKILERLNGVKRTGNDRAVALCPAHKDKSPSLSLREADGRVLIHCFSGCSASAVLDAIGLEIADLYERPIEHTSKKQKPNHWHAAREALRVLAFESCLIALAAESISRGETLTKEESRSLLKAAVRIRHAAEVCA